MRRDDESWAHMPLIDERGRLFGRVNLVDAGMLLGVCLLIPLTYGAYLLFQPEPARLVAVEPALLEPGTTIRFTVKGEHLRPALRILVGRTTTRFLFADPETGVVEVSRLDPGSYDVSLLDEAQVIHMLPGALRVSSPATNAELIAIGVFTVSGAPEGQSLWRTLQTVRPDPAHPWEILGIGAPTPWVSYSFPQGAAGFHEIRAVLRLQCILSQGACTWFDVLLSPDANVRIPLDASGATANFRVEELHAEYTGSVPITLRSYLTREELRVLGGWKTRADERLPAEAALHPSLDSFEIVGDSPSQQHIVHLRLRVPAVDTGKGWAYQHPNPLLGRPLRIGDSFSIARPFLRVEGRIIAIGSATPLNPPDPVDDAR